MRTCRRLAIIALAAILAGCQSDSRESRASGDERRQPPAERETPAKMIEYLIGEWEITDVTGGANDLETENRRIEFTSEARYIVHAGDQVIDSGAYRMNEQLNNLYLESFDDKRPREFEIEFQADEMTLRERDSASGDARYVYRRIEPASVAPDDTP